MVKVVIRDDDVNYFTNPESIKKVYDVLEDIPVSYAVIPWVKGDNGECPESKIFDKEERYDIANNNALVSYIKELISRNKGEILLHGITHEYKRSQGRRIAEMEWMDSEKVMLDEIRKSKKHLEVLFGCDVRWFVPPSNKIMRNGVNAVVESGMDLSGIIGMNFNREINREAIKNYIKRWTFRLRYGYPYPGKMKYKMHIEMNACGIHSYEYLERLYFICEKMNLPMAINVHYWNLRDDDEKRKIVYDFILSARRKSAKFVLMSEI